MPENTSPTEQNIADMAQKSGVSMEEYASKKAQQPDLNPDAIIGNILSKRAITTSQDARKTLDDVANKAVNIGNELGVKSTPVTPTPTPTPTPTQPKLSDEQNSIFDQQSQMLEQMTKSRVQDIRAQTESIVRQAQEEQKQAVGSSSTSMARMGAYGVASASMQYLNDVNYRYQAKVADIRVQAEQLVNEVEMARSEKSLEIAQKKLEALDQVKADMRAERELLQKEQAFMMEVGKYERENATQTLEAMASAGVDVPESYLETLDKQMGFPTGLSSKLLEVSKNEKEFEKLAAEKTQMMSDIEFEMKVDEFNLNQFNKIKELQSKMRPTDSIEIGGYTYYGTSNGLDYKGYEVDKSTGDIVTMVYDEDSGQMLVNKQKGVLKPNVEYTTELIGDKYFYIPKNPKDGVAVPVLSYDGGVSGGAVNTGALQTNYPEGYVPANTNNGWCLSFCYELAEDGNIPATFNSKSMDSIEAKREWGQSSGINLDNARAGMWIMTNEDSNYGHIALINSVSIDPITGIKTAYVTESNYKTDGKGNGVVSHTRGIQLTPDNMESAGGKIMGFQPANLKNDLTSQNIKPLEKELTVKEKAEQEEKEKLAEVAKDRATLIKDIVTDLTNSKYLTSATGPIQGQIPYEVRGGTSNFRRQFEQLQSMLTLDNLGLMKGVLSDKDIMILQKAGTALDLRMDETGFRKELNNILTRLGSVDVRGEATAKGYDYDAMIKAGFNDEQIKKAISG